jgi:tetratricopeptide (TPR) repeat protein
VGFDRRKLLDSAQKFLIKGQIKKAILDYEKLVADDPRNIRIRSRLADLYVRNSNIDRAVQEYIQLAKQYEDEDLSYRAISMYKKVLTIRPKMIDVHYWLADLYKKEGLFGNAKVLYQNIIKLNPEDQVARNAINEIDQTMVGASALQRENEISYVDQPEIGPSISQDHQPVFEDSVIVDDMLEIEQPSSEPISQDQEIIDLQDALDLPSGEHESAGESQQPAAHNPQFTHQEVVLDKRISPEKDLESHYHLGIAYMEMDLIDKAIAEFEAALDYGPKRIECLVMLGQCYMEKGVSDRSIFYLEKALQSEGITREEVVRISKQLGKVYEASGMKEKAWQTLKKAGLIGEN